MLFFVTAFPGRFGEWCAAVTKGLSERALGSSVEVIRAETLDQISSGLIGRRAAQAIVMSRQPAGLLRKSLVEADRNFVVAIDDPRSSLAQIVDEEGIELAAGIRAMAGTCAAFETLGAARGALLLDATRDSDDPIASATAIAIHLQLCVDDSIVTDVVRELAGVGVTPIQGNATGWWEALDANSRSILLGAISPYYRAGDSSREEAPIQWAPELFFHGDVDGRAATGPIDITGRPRCLFRGPDIPLPAGQWSLSLELIVSPEATENEFAIHVSGCEPEQHRVVRPPRDGTFAGTINLVVPETAERPISIHASSQRAAFDGTITLVGATLRSQTSLADPPLLG